MRRIKLIATLIWALNVGIIAASAFFLLRVVMPEKKVVPKSTRTPRPIDNNVNTIAKNYDRLRSMPNPMKNEKAEGPRLTEAGSIKSKIVVVASFPHPTEPACAVELLSQKGKQIAVYFKEKININDVPVPELIGWVLMEAYSDYVVFANGDKKEILPVGSSAGTDPKIKTFSSSDLVAITDWKHLKSTSIRDQYTASGEMWLIDPREAEWSAIHQERILTNDVRLFPYSEGGVIISELTTGSLIHERGFQKGDVIKSINGRGVNSIADAKTISEALRKEGPAEVIITVDRAGRTYQLRYRLKN
jgi:hypothetical protein